MGNPFEIDSLVGGSIEETLGLPGKVKDAAKRTGASSKSAGGRRAGFGPSRPSDKLEDTEGAAPVAEPAATPDLAE
jgi:hypothetical protein